MAELELSRTEVEGAGQLPAVCMQCGAPAATVAARSFNDAPVPPPILPENPLGCLLFPVWGVLALCIRQQRNEVTVRMPLCDAHARRWFNWSAPVASSITDTVVVMKGVSEEFVAAVADRRRERRGSAVDEGPLVKVRCGACRALNDESARYCGQCGGAL